MVKQVNGSAGSEGTGVIFSFKILAKKIFYFLSYGFAFC